MRHSRRSGWQLGKERRRHLGREFLKEPAWLRNVPIPEMYEREVEGPEMPVWHDFDEFARTDEFRLHRGWNFADPAAGEQRGRNPCVVVDGQKWLI